MITKNYIVATDIPINANVSDEKVAPYIPKALRQLREILPSELYAALQALYDESVKDWSKNNSYVITNKVEWSEYAELKMWKSLTTNTNSEPTTANTTDWDELELGTFLIGFVQPFLANHVFYSFAVNGGVNITHQGLQQIQNETAQPVTGTNLQAFLNYWKLERDMMKKRMFDHLDAKSNTLDAVSYTAIDADRKKPRFQIRAIGRGSVGSSSKINTIQ